MRLVRYFTPSFTRALEAVYPRSQHATQWSQANAPPPELRLSDLMKHGMQSERWGDRHGKERETRSALTTVAKYVLVAAFLASFNPAKTDMRLVGRAPDERGKKRRGGGPRKSRGGGRAKVWSCTDTLPYAFPLNELMSRCRRSFWAHQRSRLTDYLLSWGHLWKSTTRIFPNSTLHTWTMRTMTVNSRKTQKWL